MKFQNKIIVLILSILYSSFIIGPDFEYVLGSNGLNIRDESSLKSEVIEKVPFGAKLEVVSRNNNQFDTIYYSNNEGPYFMGIYNKIYHGKGKVPIITDWVKVKYNGSIGYVAGIYLHSRPIEIIETDLIYFDKYSTTWTLNFNPGEYNWYAIKVEDDRTRVVEKDIDFISQYSEYSGKVIKPIYHFRNETIGIIGVKYKIDEVWLSNSYINNDYNEPKEAIYEFDKISGPDKLYGETLKDSVWYYNCFDKIKNKRIGIFKFSKGANSPKEVRFAGDIDGDGTEDFVILCRTIYDIYFTILYLSTDIENGIYTISGQSKLDFD